MDVVFDYLINEIYVKVDVSSIHGVGLFALKDIPKNTNISIGPPEEWANIKFKVKRDRLEKELHMHPNIFKILCDWGGDRDSVHIYLPPFMKFHYYLYINYSVYPNSIYRSYHKGEDLIKQLDIICLKDIKEGEELTLKYYMRGEDWYRVPAEEDWSHNNT